MHLQDTCDRPRVHGQPRENPQTGSLDTEENAPYQRTPHQKTPCKARFLLPPGGCMRNLARNRFIGRGHHLAGRFAKVQLWARLPWATATFRTKTGRSE